MPQVLQFVPRALVYVERRADLASARPSPLIDLGFIHAVLVSVVLAVDLDIAQYFFRVGAGHLQRGHPVNNVNSEQAVEVPVFLRWPPKRTCHEESVLGRLRILHGGTYDALRCEVT